MTSIKYKDESHRVIDSSIKVHREPGPGFVGTIYQEVQEKQLIKDEVS
ncbi:MAG TPA: hypothetical protein PLO29_00235 [Paludibacter sp.]|nr:hypothetical protein [Paludibacter sp.]